MPVSLRNLRWMVLASRLNRALQSDNVEPSPGSRRSAVQINETLDFIGASLETACAQDTASLSMTVLKKDLGTGLELLADVLTQPAFPQPEIDRQKQAIIATIRATEENPGAVAGKAVRIDVPERHARHGVL